MFLGIQFLELVVILKLMYTLILNLNQKAIG